LLQDALPELSDNQAMNFQLIRLLQSSAASAQVTPTGNKENIDSLGRENYISVYKPYLSKKENALTRESTKEIIARYQQLKDLPADKKRKWDYIHNNIQDSDSQFSNKRIAVKTEGFDVKRSRNKAKNKL
jgi:hypothetical protein